MKVRFATSKLFCQLTSGNTIPKLSLLDYLKLCAMGMELTLSAFACESGEYWCEVIAGFSDQNCLFMKH